ncbi:MAG: trimeric intracellular cation channel family protein [Bacteroidaceae bacterium]|nr:trimeric intracellular cation channel family protein [Bacteroidaceae bacterium]
MNAINAIIDWGANITFIDIIDFIGTFAFAISGIRLASTKRFDWFGAYVVGAATAIGGGTIRDIMLDVPVFWMHDPFYLICTGLALLWVIIFRRYLIRMHYTFFVFDAVGLALFTVVGIQKTLECGLPIWVGIIMGTMTGAAGGVIRDVLINEEPLIFRKEIYAMACVVGGIAFAVCHWLGFATFPTHLICGATVFLTRSLAVKYSICLPTLRPEDDENGKAKS